MAPVPRTVARPNAARASVRALGPLAALCLTLAGLAAPAQARVETVPTGGGPEVTVGLQPREAAFYWTGDAKRTGLKTPGTENAAVATFGNPLGHEVVHVGSVATYAIYWDPSDYYHGDWQGLIDGFLANLGTAGGQLENVFAVDGQYTDATNKPASTHSSFHGAYTDTHPYPASGNCTDPHPWKFGVPLLENSLETVCLTDAEVKAELERFLKQRAAEHSTIPAGTGTIIYLMTPPGVTVCLDEGGPTGHCSDFDGTQSEVAQFEEAEAAYPEELENYEEALAQYKTDLKKYETEKKNFEAEKKEDPEEPPVAPVKPSLPVEPPGYVDYKKSFCSYHGVIGSGGNTVLYGMIPWTAGGDGDAHLSGQEQEPAFACQMGGFEPAAQSGGELEEKGREKPETPLEKEEFEKKNSKEKEKALETKEAGLAKTHEQEPNQLSGVGPDGSYDHGLADLIINQIAVEQQDIVTDPLLNGWQDSEGNEVTDECRNFFVPAAGSGSASFNTKAGSLSNQSLGSGQYFLNEVYNLAATQRLHPGKEFPGLPYPGVPCLNGIALDPQFTAPNNVNGGEAVGFDGMESDITLGSADKFSGGSAHPNYATYTWNFGDGARGDATPEVTGFAPGAPACEEPWQSTCAASEFHTYKYTGTYEVTLTVTDVAGNKASTTRLVSVEGEPWPEAPSPSPGSPPSTPASAPGGAGSPGSSGAGATTAATGAPVATAVIASKTLPPVLRSGLVVRYSVNQQVAGHFDVLLASSVARRVGLHGPLATGLAKGTPPQIVIGKAILATTAGGKSTIRIQLGKVTGQRLRRLGKVTLMLRLIVHNSRAQTATVLTRASLGP